MSWLQRAAALAAALLLAACALVEPTPASGELPWQQRTPGLAYLAFSPLKDSVVHVLRVDLRSPGIEVAVSPPAERGRPMSEMPSAIGSLAGVNASFFRSDFVPLGWTFSKGEAWQPRLETETGPFLACDSQPHCELHLHSPFAEPDAAKWRNVVAGRPWLVDEGRVRTPADDAQCEHLCAKTHPRTAVGIDAAGRYLYIVAAEGRRPPVLGLTLTQLSAVMLQLGARNALNLDGGGSTTMWLQGRSVAARPFNEPAMRPVANALLIRQQTPAK